MRNLKVKWTKGCEKCLEEMGIYPDENNILKEIIKGIKYMKKETILIGTKSELIDYLRNEVGILNKEQEAELRNSDIGKWGSQSYKSDIDGMSVEDQIQNIENLGKVFYMDEAVIDESGDITQLNIKLTGVFVNVSEKEES